MLQHPTPSPLAAVRYGVLIAALGALGTLSACTDAPATAPVSRGTSVGAAISTNATYNDVRIPVQNPIGVYCSRVGIERVPLQGVEHGSYQQTANANGSTHVRFHVNAQGVSGYGLVSGDLYRASGATGEDYEWDVGQYPYSHDITYTFTVEDVSYPGRAGNIRVTEVVRLDVDADGNLTYGIIKFDAVCAS